MMGALFNLSLLLLSPAAAIQVAPPTHILQYHHDIHYLSSSRLFGHQRNNWRQRNAIQNRRLFSTTTNSDNSSPNNNSVDNSSKSSSTSFLRALDNFGMKLKPWAAAAYKKSLTYTANNNDNINGTDITSTTSGSNNDIKTIRKNKFKSILYSLKSNLLWMTYIVYRGYRGFFVILPAVFKEVYHQLNESGLVLDVYGDDEEREYAVNSNAAVEGQQQNQQQPIRWRSRITISILSAMLTLSYVVGGALRVLGSFIKTFTNTTSVEASLEAAADEVVENEDKLRNKLKHS